MSDPARAALLGDGSTIAAGEVVQVFESFLLAPTPGSSDDPYVRLHPKVVTAVRDLLDGSMPEQRREDAAERLVLAVEPICCKLLAFTEPAKFEELTSKKKGLGALLTALRKAGRSRYTLELSPEEFERTEGWDARTSYENAIRDVVPARLKAAHAAAVVNPESWRSTMAVVLGLIDANLANLCHLPRPDDPSFPGGIETLEIGDGCTTSTSRPGSRIALA